MSRAVKAFYFSSKITNTIIESQVINWIKLLNETGSVKFILCFQVPVIDFFSKKEQKKYTKAQSNIRSGVIKLPILRTRWNFIYEKIILFLYVLLSTGKKQKIIIQTRENKHAQVVSWLRHFRSVYFIYEHRGVGAEEYINNLGYETIDNVEDKQVKREYYAILDVYEEIFRVADSIVNVSEQMKVYVQNVFDGKFNSKLIVIPGGADQDIFNYSVDMRVIVRERLKITETQTVLLYSGSLKQKWHMREFLFQSVAQALNLNHDLFFICITPDIEIAVGLLEINDISRKRTFIGFVPNSEINQYLAAADIGLVFRENIATNKFSSPTKIAEYLLAGLPVLLSDNIGDYSDFIKSNQSGRVVKNDTDCIVKNIDFLRSIDRKQIAKNSALYYSKQSLLSKYIQLYKAASGAGELNLM